uniref:Uncharacterized protein n=1 Tax=Rhizophora mucronata TaxID=61149 RepID=A0A2P2KY72_RHIMU
MYLKTPPPTSPFELKHFSILYLYNLSSYRLNFSFGWFSELEGKDSSFELFD